MSQGWQVVGTVLRAAELEEFNASHGSLGIQLFIVDVRKEASIAEAAAAVSLTLLQQTAAETKHRGGGRDKVPEHLGSGAAAVQPIRVSGERVPSREENVGPLDVLLNCAGVASCAPLELTTSQEFESVFGVNVFGGVAVIRHFLPMLRAAAARRGAGEQVAVRSGKAEDQASLHAPRIITMSSIVGRVSLPWASVYSASKHAIEAICDSARLELGPQV